MYDANGDLLLDTTQKERIANATFNCTCKDFQNLARYRGAGYQLVDYEMHKDIANLWMAVHGRRNSQAVHGVGVGVTNIGGTDGTNRSPFYETSSGRPRFFGLEDWWACASEWMDNVAVNVASYAAYYKNKSVVPSGSVVDHTWRIRMPDGTERVVLGRNASGDTTEIVRVRNGRFADVIPSMTTQVANVNSMVTYYCDAQWYSASTGRCVLRSGYSASLHYGFVNVNAVNDASYSSTVYGSRLAFRGEIEFVE